MVCNNMQCVMFISKYLTILNNILILIYVTNKYQENSSVNKPVYGHSFVVKYIFKMIVTVYLQVGILFHLFSFKICWKYLTSLSDIYLTDTDNFDVEVWRSEFVFGDCQHPKKEFLTQVHKDRTEVLGKLIVRGWLYVLQMPMCIMMRATSYEEDAIRSTGHNFQVCVPRVKYLHSKTVFEYFYFELYLPGAVTGDMDWDLYFYGYEKNPWD